MKQRVAVIGAGSSGLVCLKELLAEGHDAVAFEARRAVGGVFRSTREGGRAYDAMRLTSSNYVTAFSDLPPDERAPRHWDFEEYIDYLERYVEHFDLADRIRYGFEARRLQRKDDGWHLETVGPGGIIDRDVFDAVAICTGIVQRPHRPPFPDQERYRGRIVHSADVRDAAPFAGHKVVIVGAGETGSDLVHAIAEVADACHLSLRRGVWVIPRLVRGVPNDFHTCRVLHGLPRALLDALSLARARIHRLAGRIPGLRRLVDPATRLRAELLLASGGGAFAQFAVKSAAMIEPLVDGRCQRHPAIERFLADGVVFTDGSRVKADRVVLCTGYRHGFPFLREEIDAGRLYRRIFHPDHDGSLAFIGFARPAIGAIPPLAEMQSRWFALVCSGKRLLPDPAAMERQTASQQAWALDRFGVLADRLPTLVDYTRYLDTLAVEIGCRPDLMQLARTDPSLAWRLFTRPFVGAQFRLEGPHACPDVARQMIDGAPPVMAPPFLAFLLVCHLASRALAGLGLTRLTPALALSPPDIEPPGAE